MMSNPQRTMLKNFRPQTKILPKAEGSYAEYGAAKEGYVFAAGRQRDSFGYSIEKDMWRTLPSARRTKERHSSSSRWSSLLTGGSAPRRLMFNDAIYITLPGITASKMLSWLIDASAANDLTFEDVIGARLKLDCTRAKSPNANVTFRITNSTYTKTREFHLSIDLAIDLARFGVMLVDPFSSPPAIVIRVRKVNALLGFRGNVEDRLGEVIGLPDDQIAKLLMGLAAGGREDLAVGLLERLALKGRMRDIGPASAWSPYNYEQPEHVTWADLERWSGSKLELMEPEFIERSKQQKDASGLSPFDYVDCFERAFELPFEKIPFDMMDFKDVQARLRRLDEYIDAYYERVAYPVAEPGQLIPYIAPREQWTHGVGFGYREFRYTPPIWHEEARRALLFAHKLCFEDSLPQLIGPITSAINAKTYSYDGRQVEPDKVHPSHFELLRRTLVNAQKMATLIRRGIVLPHCLLNSRIPGYSEDDSSIRFRDRNSYFLAEELANRLGELISRGLADNFGLPTFILKRAKEVAPEVDDWKDIAWFEKFFNEISVHGRHLPQDDPIRLWPFMRLHFGDTTLTKWPGIRSLFFPKGRLSNLCAPRSGRPCDHRSLVQGRNAQPASEVRYPKSGYREFYHRRPEAFRHHCPQTLRQCQ